MLSRFSYRSLLFFLMVSLAGLACKKDSPAQQEPSASAVEAQDPAVADQAKAPAPQDASVGIVRTGATGVIDNPFFYEVEGKDGTRAHLFGTMHMGIDADKELPASVWAALDQAQTLAIEADISDPSLVTLMKRTDGKTLRDDIGEENYKLLEEALGSFMADAMNTMKPMAAASTLALKGLPMTTPMEMSFVSKAKGKGKDVQYLETGAFQIGVLDEVMTADVLVEMLKNPKETEMPELLKMYREGNDTALRERMLRPEDWGKNPEKKIEKLFFKRNADWVPKIEALMKKGPVLVAVGAGHLLGERSVVDLLQKKGYKVTRIQ